MRSFEFKSKFCPKCDGYKRFIKYGNSPVLIRCTNCLRTIKPLGIISLIKDLKLNANSFVYELSFHGAVFDYLKSNFTNFFFSEFFPNSPTGKKVNGVHNQDVQNLTFKNDFFNLITCTEVFEHVPNYLAGFSEVLRTLKKGGIFCFTVPLYSKPETEKLCEIDSSGNLKWHGIPEFHDSRLTGPRTVPVFWKHSEIQIIEDLKNIGFLNAEIKCDYSFSKGVPVKIVIAYK